MDKHLASAQARDIENHEQRIERIEYKLDQVKDELYEMKSDLKIHSERVADKFDLFEKHITGDNKIINNIQPLIDKMPEITKVLDEYQFEQHLKRKNLEKIKKISMILGIISLIIGISVGISKLI